MNPPLSQEKIIIGYASGTFDLFHVGHLKLLERARAQCDYLVVGVHRTAAFKGGEICIPFEERTEILRACRYVDRVVEACDEDTDDWERIHFDRLFVGDDYLGSERFRRYEEYFREKGVEIVYFPYTKTTSSSAIRKRIRESGAGK